MSAYWWLMAAGGRCRARRCARVSDGAAFQLEASSCCFPGHRVLSTAARTLAASVLAVIALSLVPPLSLADVTRRRHSPTSLARQVTLLIVDKAILDLKPYPAPNVTSDMALDTSASLDVTTLDARRGTRAALNATFEALQVCVLVAI